MSEGTKKVRCLYGEYSPSKGFQTRCILEKEHKGECKFEVVRTWKVTKESLRISQPKKNTK